MFELKLIDKFEAIHNGLNIDYSYFGLHDF